METNASMTHFHKDIINHKEVWKSKYYEKVMWQQQNVINPSTGFVEATEVNVYIPQLAYDIKNEDIIVRGKTESMDPSNIKNKFVVTSAIHCDFGSERMQHTELVGR